MSWARLAQRLAHKKAFYGSTIVEFVPFIGMDSYAAVGLLEGEGRPAYRDSIKEEMCSRVGEKLIEILIERGEETPTTLVAEMVRIPEKGYLSNPPYQVGFHLQIYEVKPSLKEACELHRQELLRVELHSKGDNGKI